MNRALRTGVGGGDVAGRRESVGIGVSTLVVLMMELFKLCGCGATAALLCDTMVVTCDLDFSCLVLLVSKSMYE